MSGFEAFTRAAEAHLARREISAARAAALSAASLAGGSSFLSNLLGRIEEADNRYVAARDYFEAAVRAAPADAGFRASLANSWIHSGDFDRARTEIGEALAINPQHAGALQLYAMITRISSADDFVDRVRVAIDGAANNTRKTSTLLFVLGKAHDDRGEFDDAFAAFRRANELRPSRYSPEEHERFVGRVMEVWTHERIDRLAPLGYHSQDIAFIMGMPRSGSTLLQQKLAADPRVESLGEASDIAAISAAMERNHPRAEAYPGWCADFPDAAWRGIGELYAGNARSRRPGAALYVNKNLFNWLFGGVIIASLPQALLVEIRRNALDACLSCYFTDLHEAHNYSVRLDTLGHMHRLTATLMTHWRESCARIALVRYEELIADTDGTAAGILSRAGLEPRDSSAPTDEPATQTFSAWQVRQPVYTHAVARWKNYEKHLGPLIDALGDLAV